MARSSPASPSASSQAVEAWSQKPFWVTHVRLALQASLWLELLQTSRATVGHFRVFLRETLEGLSSPWPPQIYYAAPQTPDPRGHGGQDAEKGIDALRY